METNVKENKVNSKKKENYNVYANILECIKNNDLEEAKNICKKNLDNKNIFDLYILIIERERVQNSNSIKSL